MRMLLKIVMPVEKGNEAGEPLFEILGADIHVTPVMNGEDLQRGMKEAGM